MDYFHTKDLRHELLVELTEYVSVNAGHGGSRAAEFVQKNLFNNLLTHPKFSSDTRAAIGMHN